MRKLSESELLTLTGLLTMETDALAVAKATHMLIKDSDLKKSAEAGIMTAERRIQGMQQFINENQVLGTGEVQ
ncbi:hypothetical protein CLPU_1c02690 [Gottschalkia purinilytica]|uniref:Spore coat protein n=1 Tax=Gottschalkia purinilytica TaxID=1503 RepID=A0A0L0WF57_GOTPU|nr:hypothetical protein [Gottschalkia purinilytica]KNF10104.1 hypothetical protein CLPU_1c02690 [Gottschalkia purinilytica]